MVRVKKFGKEANIKINDILTIEKAGEYTFTGTLSDGQIAVNANDIDGEVKIVLDNVSITSENAPAIFIYSKNIYDEKCKVTIETAKDSTNEITGGKIKQSVIDFKNQEEILYSVEKNYNDEGEYFERYKYDGAISSDISITFDGEGTLNVYSNKKEGIEGKMHITVNGGTLIIKSVDDAINAAADGESIITINDGTVIAFLTEEAEEGDGIDSNGEIIINGGKVYSFACPGSDSGLDADKGTTINGGEVISTGSMNDVVTFSKDINYARATFNRVNIGDIICVANEENEIVFAMKTDRVIQNFLYTSDKLEKDKEYAVYTNANVEGTLNEWNIYTDITLADTSTATKNDFDDMKGFNGMRPNDVKINQNTKKVGIVLLVVGVVLFVIVIILDLKKENKKSKIVNLLLGIIIGASLTFGIYSIMINNNLKMPDMGEMQFQKPMENRGEMKVPNSKENMNEKDEFKNSNV